MCIQSLICSVFLLLSCLRAFPCLDPSNYSEAQKIESPTMAKDTKTEADTLRKMVKDSTNANNKLAKQMGELKDVLAAGFTKVSNALDALGSLGPLIAHTGDTIAQLTAINSHYVQHGQSLSDVASELAKISGTMVKSASTSSKMSPATNPHARPLNLGTTTGVKGWMAGVTMPDHIPLGIVVGPESVRALLEHMKVSGFGYLFCLSLRQDLV